MPPRGNDNGMMQEYKQRDDRTIQITKSREEEEKKKKKQQEVQSPYAIQVPDLEAFKRMQEAEEAQHKRELTPADSELEKRGLSKNKMYSSKREKAHKAWVRDGLDSLLGNRTLKGGISLMEDDPNDPDTSVTIKKPRKSVLRTGQKTGSTSERLAGARSSVNRKRKLRSGPSLKSDDLNEVHNRSLRKSLEHTPAARKNRFIKYPPEAEGLVREFKDSFADRISDIERKTRVRIPESRLYIRNENTRNIYRAVDEVNQNKYDVMKEYVEDKDINCNPETIKDLSMFATSADESAGRIAMDRYLGVNRDRDRSRITGQDVSGALDIITKQLFDMDMTRIRLDNDREIAKNAYELEILTGRVAAYDRLLRENPEYFQGLDEGIKNAIKIRLKELRAIALYYIACRALICDEYYKNHYNDELSMEVDPGTPEDQRRIAQGLIDRYVFGQNMMRVHRYSDDDVKSVGEIYLVSETSREMYDKAVKTTESDAQRDYIEQAYLSADYIGIQS